MNFISTLLLIESVISNNLTTPMHLHRLLKLVLIIFRTNESHYY